MGPYLFDPFAFPGEAGLMSSKQMLTTWKLRELIPTCAEFSPEVRSWCETLRTLQHSIAGETILFQKWWKENENAFKQRAYARVRPGDIAHVGMMPPDPYPHLQPVEAASAPPSPQRKPSLPIPPGPSAVPAAGVSSTRAAERNLWGILGTFVVGIALGLLGNRRRRNA